MWSLLYAYDIIQFENSAGIDACRLLLSYSQLKPALVRAFFLGGGGIET